MLPPSTEGFICLPGEGRTVDAGEFEVSVIADGDQTDGICSVIETGGEPDVGPPLHIHRDEAEAFYILEGEYVMVLDDREVTCPAGSFVFIPAGMPHTFRAGPGPSRKLNFYFPAAMVGYFEELGEAVRRGDGEEALAAIAGRHNMEVVGPVPEGYV
jgi:mannose-6-phosphate isomerase-like protein (cupin superfamily)